MSWHLAPALVELRAQVDAGAPHRSRDSDGTIGDASHQARKSDHDPDRDDVVDALDLTHDPAGGFDSYAFAEWLRQKQDPRIKYVISNRRIFDGPGMDHPAWTWHPYTGLSPHDHHSHISVRMPPYRDDVQAWDVGGFFDTPGQAVTEPAAASPGVPAPAPYVRPPATLRRGDIQPSVAELQRLLNAHGAHLALDEDFGAVTEAAVRAFQAAHGMVVDGVAGAYTWTALKSDPGGDGR